MTPEHYQALIVGLTGGTAFSALVVAGWVLWRTSRIHTRLDALEEWIGPQQEINETMLGFLEETHRAISALESRLIHCETNAKAAEAQQ